MKDFFKYFFASLLAIFVSGILLMFVFFIFMSAIIGSATTSNVATIKDNSVLEIDLNHQISEIPQANILSAITGNSNGSSVGLYETIRAIEAAKSDEKIKGIYLKSSGNANAWATSQQIRNALKDFKTSGKFVYAYADGISQKAYYIASVADSVFINPLGAVEFKGLSTSLMFYKGLLDKLEVEPEIFYCGKFKSATEPIRAYKMTEENRTQIAAYQADLWSQMISAVQEHTKLEPQTLDSLVQKGLIQTAQDAVQYHFADGLRYQDEVEASIKSKLKIKSNEEINFASLSDYKTRLSQKPSTNQIALLIAEGNIVDGKSGTNAESVIASEDFIENIRKIKADSNIKAVVMRVNSPGGSAMASENILRELNLLQQKKKLIVTMGDYAASGGYYIACNADSIFALPNTLTGSIGVFSVMMNLQKLYTNKLGITFDVEKNAPLADFAEQNHGMTVLEKKIIQNSVDTIYNTFKTRVATGRNLDMLYVDSVGQGRVWTGTKALELKLVDALGDLNTAITCAANMAKIKDYKVVTYPKPVSDMERLVKILNAQSGTSSLVNNFMEFNKRIGMPSNAMSAWSYFDLLINYPNAKWTMLPFIPETN